MASNEFQNGDLRLLGQKIDGMSAELQELKYEQKKFHQEVTDASRRRDIQIALLEQANLQICKDVEKQGAQCEKFEERLNKQDNINKIVGGFTAGLYALAGLFGISR